MDKLIFGILLCLTLNSTSYSQSYVYSMNPASSFLNVDELMDKYDNEPHKIINGITDIQGSPYVFEEFQAGIVYSKNENRKFKIRLNLNAYTNLFEFIYKNELYTMPNYIFDSVEVNYSVYIPISIVEDDKVKFFIMNLIDTDHKGNYLLKKDIVKFMDRVEEKPFISGEPPRYKKFPPEYYIYTSNKEMVLIDKLKVFSELSDDSEKIDRFIRKGKFRKRNIDNLMEIFNYIYK